jgi:hypothetical protein
MSRSPLVLPLRRGRTRDATVLAHPDLNGTGLVETQRCRATSSRKRYPRPAYVPVGNFRGFPMLRPYIAFGFGAPRRRTLAVRVRVRATTTRTARMAHRGSRIGGAAPQRVDGLSPSCALRAGSGFTTHPLRFAIATRAQPRMRAPRATCKSSLRTNRDDPCRVWGWMSASTSTATGWSRGALADGGRN